MINSDTKHVMKQHEQEEGSSDHNHHALPLSNHPDSGSSPGLLTKTLYALLVHTHISPFWIQLFYFLSLSLLGFLLLKALPARSDRDLRDLDVFFTSVSAATVSSMSTVNMEDLSNPQLVVMTLLMLAGGEIFTSLLSLHFKRIKLRHKLLNKELEEVVSPNQLELGLSITSIAPKIQRDPNDNDNNNGDENMEGNNFGSTPKSSTTLEYESIRCLCFAVMCYLLVFHFFGILSILSYVTSEPTARDLLASKGIRSPTFAVFVTVSSFTNCGFIPTNENMMAFRNNSGLLLLVIPLVLGGNTLYPPCLRVTIRLLKRFGGKRGQELESLLSDGETLGYSHLLPARHCLWLVGTVLGFATVQVVLFCSMEWASEGLKGMGAYRKLVGALFQSFNTRYAGESIVDISAISQAILVLYVVMMYLPPYTRFVPTEGERDMTTIFTNHDSGREKEEASKGKRRDPMWRKLVFSQLSYLAIFVILVCITEREKLSSDPLNFNVLNIVVEVISAYGNVGLSTCYSCARQLTPDPECRDAWYGFAGRWSPRGKLILIIVMFFGRLKSFGMGGGRSWKLG